MNDKTTANAEKALKITTALTLLVSGYEVLRSCQNYREGMNFLDIASYANADLNTYCLVLILVNIIFLPSAILLYKQSGISLRYEIYEKKSLGRDITAGVVLAVISSVISLLSLIAGKGRTELAFAGRSSLSAGEIVLMIISLGFVSGICKEIYFRGFAKNFCGSVFGETAALLLFNAMFGMLDWFNIGHSFIVGVLWIWGYKKSGHLIVPMIAHGGMNLISVAFYIITA
ncbi:MAG: CPBP family intramembrane metalloprotease [Oscillospiraceae bacterium]|nr:CPBP family intramembrane metalloprotease [Oscillospiraceae bacterium]MDY6207300.1 CPBP family intramembrane glutamic endopeptidase [Oscillospiraceae bacterium]